ncbi:conserved hypothetical protein [delta proteobacterium NaphS2]|nr:conserved hypothetical protein [delta proteobacterium NaphS2]
MFSKNEIANCSHLWVAILRVVAICCIVFAFSSNATAATYFLRADGKASNKSSAMGSCSDPTACMSPTVHNAQSFDAGDNIILCDDGGEYSSPLILPSSGSSWELPITYRNETNGKATLNGLSSITSWQNSGNGIYTRQGIEKAWMLLENGMLIRHASDTSLSDGYWYFDEPSSTLYYKPTQGVAEENNVSIVSNLNCININNKSFIVVDGLTFKYFYWAVHADNRQANSGTAGTRHGPRVLNCTAQFGRGLLSSIATAGYDVYDLSAVANTVINCGQPLRAAPAAEGPMVHINLNFSKNSVIDTNRTGLDTEKWEDLWGAIDAEGIAFYNANSALISENLLEGGCDNAGIVMFVGPGGSMRNNITTRNKLTNLVSQGISLAGDAPDEPNASGNMISANVIERVGTRDGIDGAILVHRIDNENNINYIFNNTIVECDVSFRIGTRGNRYIFKNNISVNPTLFHVCMGIPIAENKFDHNLYYPDGNLFRTLEAGDIQFTQWQGRISQDLQGSSTNPNFASGYSLDADSPAIDSGERLAVSETKGLAPGTYWPSAVATLDQGTQGLSWEIGAYVFPSSISPPNNLQIRQ